MNELLLLALAFGRISLGSFAGGLASIALIYHEVVIHYHWLSPEEFEQMISLAQMSPGPIAVNAATYIGKRLAGLPGAVVATAFMVGTPIILLLTIAYTIKFFPLGKSQTQNNSILRPGVAALLTASALRLIVIPGEPIYMLLTPLALFLLLKSKAKDQPSLAIILCGVLAVATALAARAL